MKKDDFSVQFDGEFEGFPIDSSFLESARCYQHELWRFTNVDIRTVVCLEHERDQ